MSNWSKITSDGKGGFDLIENWNVGYEILYRGGAKIIVIAFLGMLFGPLFPLFFLISYPIRTLEGKMENIVTGSIITVLFLFDYWLGGLGWVFYNNWAGNGSEFAMTMFTFFGNLNMALLLVFIILWFLTPSIGESIDIFKNTHIYFYLVTAFIIWKILLPLTSWLAENTMADTPLGFLKEFYHG